MKEMTQTNLQAALAGESQAHLRYTVYAGVAEHENLPNVARLFRAAAFSEQLHATAHLRALGGIGTSAQNLKGAFGGESFEIAEMYPAYQAVAQLQDEKAALTSMQRALEAEKVHAKLYSSAQQAVEAKKDLGLEDIFVCEVCGFTMEGVAPDRCPVCGAGNNRFKKF
jgi:rubrerythrin